MPLRLRAMRQGDRKVQVLVAAWPALLVLLLAYLLCPVAPAQGAAAAAADRALS